MSLLDLSICKKNMNKAIKHLIVPFLIGFLTLGTGGHVWGQFSLDTVKLTNPSFEDEPQNSVPPEGWVDCGFRNETPPDVHPIDPPSQGWHVTMKPQDGKTYMGMVVRDNDTWERVSQELKGKLERGKCYGFKIWLARSPVYVSPSHITRQITNYTTPVVLRIWGGNADCDRQVLLGESSPVANTTWEKYSFQFHPHADFTHIMLEAFYETPTLFPYNGNILLDNASHIYRIPCNESETEEMEDLLAQADYEEKRDEGDKIAAQATPSAKANIEKQERNRTASNPSPSKEEKEEKGERARADKERAGQPVQSLGGYHKSQLEEGQLIRINRLYFDADATEIKKESFEDLSQIAYFLIDNPEVVVEIGGHTNDLPSDDYCLKLSTDRARSVTNYLIGKGVDEDRLTYKGYGKAKPVATNKTAVGRRMNQRVEIKILSVGGN
jgi:outer membrane protein OmpA-like peptidoglycan-associated protein